MHAGIALEPYYQNNVLICPLFQTLFALVTPVNLMCGTISFPSDMSSVLISPPGRTYTTPSSLPDPFAPLYCDESKWYPTTRPHLPQRCRYRFSKPSSRRMIMALGSNTAPTIIAHCGNSESGVCLLISNCPSLSLEVDEDV